MCKSTSREKLDWRQFYWHDFEIYLRNKNIVFSKEKMVDSDKMNTNMLFTQVFCQFLFGDNRVDGSTDLL